jgi:hypothetical protein
MTPQEWAHQEWLEERRAAERARENAEYERAQEECQHVMCACGHERWYHSDGSGACGYGSNRCQCAEFAEVPA